MLMPKEKKIHCPKCNKHTPHKVSLQKKGKVNTMTQGTRRYDRKKQGYGSQPKPIFHRNSKVNKKSVPVYKCKVCGRSILGKGLRLKKFEIMTK